MIWSHCGGQRGRTQTLIPHTYCCMSHTCTQAHKHAPVYMHSHDIHSCSISFLREAGIYFMYWFYIHCTGYMALYLIKKIEFSEVWKGLEATELDDIWAVPAPWTFSYNIGMYSQSSSGCLLETNQCVVVKEYGLWTWTSGFESGHLLCVLKKVI